MRYLGFILVLLTALSSCDSREDWFAHNSEGQDLIVTVNGVTDTIFKGESRYIVVDLHSKRIDEDHCMYTDTVVLTFTSENPMKLVEFKDLAMCFEGDGKVVTANISRFYGVPTWGVTYFESDTTAKLLESRRSTIWAWDAFENIEYYNIIINMYAPIPPTPVLKVERIGSDYEYALSLDDSYDRDGKVIKYEWCIDGNIVPYSIEDNRFEHVRNGVWKSGKAAYGGTYITAASLSRINHSFQTTGEHTVYYRCMDDMGIWSMWYSKKINVE